LTIEPVLDLILTKREAQRAARGFCTDTLQLDVEVDPGRFVPVKDDDAIVEMILVRVEFVGDPIVRKSARKNPFGALVYLR
jgi:hypothetical protein